jgi:carboxylesterase type B
MFTKVFYFFDFFQANSYSKLPVLFIIHGGGFEMGTSQQYAHYRDIGATFVQHGIVVVSIQYRLGLLGSFSIFHKNFSQPVKTSNKDF